MAITPDPTPFDPQKKQADRDAVFTPIAPIEKPVFVPEPENPVNPFVALNPALTSVELPKKKQKPLPPAVASLVPHGEPLPASRPDPSPQPQSKQAKHLFENISINIAPEFMPAKQAAAHGKEMDFSLDYKNPEAEILLKSGVEKLKEQPCHTCGTRNRTMPLLVSSRGPVCPKCYNPYAHRLFPHLFPDPEAASGFEKGAVAILHFLASWIVPLLPAILCYALFVRTGFGGFFEDFATILYAPTVAGLAFVFLLLAGLFFIPAGMASVSLGKTIAGSLAGMTPGRLFPLIGAALPGYLLTYGILTGTFAVNLSALALCAEAGVGGISNVLAVFAAVGMSAAEMGAGRAVYLRILPV